MATDAAHRLPLTPTARPASPVARVRAALPRGSTLPAPEFARRHRMLLGLLWLHAAALPLYGLARGVAVGHAGLEGLAVAGIALLATMLRGPERQRTASAVVATGLLTASAIVVHLSEGVIEAHFHFFVVIAALALYEDWVPFLLGGAYVAAHHGIVGVLAPELVYDHPAAVAHPWRWAAVHAGFVGVAGAVAVVAWRLNEDVRQRHRDAERALERNARDLERSNRELEQFAHVASHDLVEPLRTVIGFLELLERGGHADALDDGGRGYVRHAADGAARLHAMVDGLLVSSRSGREPLAARPVELDGVADDVLAALARLVAEREARVAVGPLPVVRGDVPQLRQLLQNLVHNAIKFTPAERAPDVRIDAQRDGETWTVRVADRGRGVDPAAAERIFELFHRSVPAEGAAGSGIGLAVCRRIVTRHGGRIWAEPVPGGGTLVSFTLPAA
jgi:signal transduction histidine kinase